MSSAAGCPSRRRQSSARLLGWSENTNKCGTGLYFASCRRRRRQQSRILCTCGGTTKHTLNKLHFAKLIRRRRYYDDLWGPSSMLSGNDHQTVCQCQTMIIICRQRYVWSAPLTARQTQPQLPSSLQSNITLTFIKGNSSST